MNKDRMLDELSVLQERFANGMGWRDGEYEEALDEAIELINQMPSADVVEVVRCKNCKHCEKAEEKYEGDRFEPTDIVCTVNNVYTYSNGFCSYGERIETE